MRRDITALLQRLPVRIALAVFAVLLIAWCAVARPVKAERRLAERIAAGKAVPWHFYAPVWSWRGLTAALPVAALLVAAAAVGSSAGLREKAAPPMQPTTRGQRLVLLTATAALALTAGGRLSLSLWGDEDYTVKTYLMEQVETRADGGLSFSYPTWGDALWNFKRPNNHIGFTVLAKLSHQLLYRQSGEPQSFLFKEWILRLPAWAAGLLSVWSLWWMAGVYGWRGWHTVAVLFLLYALHPWVVRFSAEARGYSLLLLLVPLGLGCAGRAVQTLRWRWWLLLGLVQFYALWTWVSAVYVLLPLNAAMALQLWQQQGPRLPALARWLCSGLLTTLLVCLLMAPLLPQMQDFLRSGAKGLSGAMDVPWWQDMAAYSAVGLPWYAWDAGNPLCYSVSQLGGLRYALACICLPLLGWALLRALPQLWTQAAHRWLVLVPVGGPLCMFTHMGLAGLRPYSWYLLLLLPGWLLLLMVAGSGRKSLHYSLLLPCVLAWVVMLSAYPSYRYPLEPSRDSVLLTRKVTNPHHADFGKDSITAGCTMFTEAYDPTLVRISTVEELRALMQEAKQSQRALFINFSSRAFCEASFPELFQLFNDQQLFELVQVLPGQFPAVTREVLKAR